MIPAREAWQVPHPGPALRGAVRDTFGTPLSPREDELMRLFADGATYAETAWAMGIAYATVNNHLTSIRGRLGAVSTTHAVSLWTRRDAARLAAL